MGTGRMGRKDRKAGWVGVALAAMLVSGCLGDQSVADLEPSSLWEATLSPTQRGPASELPQITGQAAVIVFGATSRVGVAVEGADRTLYWGIFGGTCSAPAELLLDRSTYPPIPEGTTELEIALPTTLDAQLDYHIRVAVDPEMELTVACGDFVLRPT